MSGSNAKIVKDNETFDSDLSKCTAQVIFIDWPHSVIVCAYLYIWHRMVIFMHLTIPTHTCLTLTTHTYQQSSFALFRVHVIMSSFCNSTFIYLLSSIPFLFPSLSFFPSLCTIDWRCSGAICVYVFSLSKTMKEESTKWRKRLLIRSEKRCAHL